MKKLSDENKEFITHLYSVEYKKITEISSLLNISRSAVLGILQKLGIWKQHNHPKITPSDIEQMITLYNEHKSVWKVGKKLGMSGQIVYKHLSALNIIILPNYYTEAELAIIKEEYSKPDLEFSSDRLSKTLNRNIESICRKAGELGLTDSHKMSKLKIETTTKLGAATKERIKTKGHPKGMLGKKHSIEAKQKISAAAKANPETFEKSHARGLKAVQTKIKRGTTSNISKNTYSRCKRGFREDLGNVFFRSSWEANYARYLNYLVNSNQIYKWEFEPDTFIFHGETRGAITYLPDFKIYTLNGNIEYHEIKGWMDAKSKSKLKKMAAFYPNIELKLIDSKLYYKLEKEFKLILPFWEYKAKII